MSYALDTKIDNLIFIFSNIDNHNNNYNDEYAKKIFKTIDFDNLFDNDNEIISFFIKLFKNININYTKILLFNYIEHNHNKLLNPIIHLLIHNVHYDFNNFFIDNINITQLNIDNLVYIFEKYYECRTAILNKLSNDDFIKFQSLINNLIENDKNYFLIEHFDLLIDIYNFHNGHNLWHNHIFNFDSIYINLKKHNKYIDTCSYLFLYNIIHHDQNHIINLNNNKEIIYHSISKYDLNGYNNVLKLLPTELINNNLVEICLDINPNYIEYILHNYYIFKNYINFNTLLSLVKNNGLVLKYLDFNDSNFKQFFNDISSVDQENLYFEACKNNGYAIQYIPFNYRLNNKIINFQSLFKIIYDNKYNNEFDFNDIKHLYPVNHYSYFKKSFYNKILYSHNKLICDYELFKIIPDQFKDFELCLNICINNFLMLNYIPITIKNDMFYIELYKSKKFSNETFFNNILSINYNNHMNISDIIFNNIFQYITIDFNSFTFFKNIIKHKLDKNLIAKLCYKNYKLLSLIVNTEYELDKEHYINCCIINGLSFTLIPNKYKNNSNCIKSLLNINNKKDCDTILSCIHNNDNSDIIFDINDIKINVISKKAKKIKYLDFTDYTKILQTNPYVLKYMKDDDKDIHKCLIAIEKNPKMIDYTPNKFLTLDFYKQAINKNNKVVKILKPNILQQLMIDICSSSIINT